MLNARNGSPEKKFVSARLRLSAMIDSNEECVRSQDIAKVQRQLLSHYQLMLVRTIHLSNALATVNVWPFVSLDFIPLQQDESVLPISRTVPKDLSKHWQVYRFVMRSNTSVIVKAMMEWPAIR